MLPDGCTYTQEDQERLARMVSPYVDEAGRAQAPIDEDVLFFKRGLDLRLMEFDEDCRRIKVGAVHARPKVLPVSVH